MARIAFRRGFASLTGHGQSGSVRAWFVRLALSLFLLNAALAHAQPNVVVTEHVRAELVAHAPAGIAPGKTVWLGLYIRHQPNWHTYWKNPGDSGLATNLTWTLPPGFAVGEIYWPTPKQLPVGPLMNYGYEGDLLLSVPLTVPDGFNGSSVPIQLRADWLVCKELCLPESGDFKLELPIAASTTHAALFGQAHESQPLTVSALTATAQPEANALVIEARDVPKAFQGKTLQVFPEAAGVIEHAAAITQHWDGDKLTLRLPLSAQRSESPASMDVVMTADRQVPGIRFGFDITGQWSQLGAAVAASAIPAPAEEARSPVSTAAGGTSWLLTLVFAFIGGAILNLMPCVFPVLSLKVIGFARHSDDRRKVVAGGLAYTTGVVASFLLLAALLLVLRSSGEQLGWGFQLQSPLFVTGLAILFTLIGLNLAGLFEFGNVLPSSVVPMRARNPVADDFLGGVLVVAVASPCTAPFMGAALGAALTQPAPHALAVFAALGLGMAAPYLAASLFPGVARLMPRPGAWMARFKTLMAFPMFATVIWLVWVLGQQVGMDGVAAVLGLLVAIAFAVWAIGMPARSSATRGIWIASAALLVTFVSVWAWPALHPVQSTNDTTSAESAATDIWQAWSPQMMQRARQEGQPVFVEFTAAWCVTCQYNKRTTLSDESLLKEFKARNVLLLRADWTRRDERITKELERLGRSGVPVYALYAAGAEQPKLLSELLSVAEVRQALESM